MLRDEPEAGEGIQAGTQRASKHPQLATTHMSTASETYRSPQRGTLALDGFNLNILGGGPQMSLVPTVGPHDGLVLLLRICRGRAFAGEFDYLPLYS